MSFSCVLFNQFSKPLNSTRLPAGGDSFPCEAVEPFSVINPRISFNQGNGWNPSLYNYCYLSELSRYYYVDNWTFEAGLWYVDLSVDPMTSWKSAILSRQEYVLRSASSYDTHIIDQIYPATTDYYITDVSFRPFAATELHEGSFVLGVANGRENSRGGVTYYCGNQNDMSGLFEFMFSSTDWINGPNIEEISQDLLKCLINPAQYLTSLMWFPVPKEMLTNGDMETVGAGWWQTDTTLNIATGSFSVSGELARERHPQFARGSYLDYAPYTRLKLYVPGFGMLDLNPEIYPSRGIIKLKIRVDSITGAGDLFVYPDGSQPGAGQQFAGQIGVPLSITSMKSDVLGALTTVTSGFSNGMGLIQSTIGAAGAVADAAKILSPDVSIAGNNGNMSVFANNATLTMICKKLVNEDNDHLGRPLCKKVLLSSLKGYAKVADFDTNLPCTKPEMEMIKSYVEGGFFIE